MQNIFIAIVFLISFLIFGRGNSTPSTSPSTSRSSIPTSSAENIQKSIKSNDINDAEADQYLSKVKKLYGGEFTILTVWNRLSKKEKVEYGKKFCQWEPGQKTYDLRRISSQLLDGDANYFDSAAEASVLVTVSIEFFCKEKYRDYAVQVSEEFLKSRNQ